MEELLNKKWTSQVGIQNIPYKIWFEWEEYLLDVHTCTLMNWYPQHILRYKTISDADGIFDVFKHFFVWDMIIDCFIEANKFFLTDNNADYDAFYYFNKSKEWKVTTKKYAFNQNVLSKHTKTSQNKPQI